MKNQKLRMCIICRKMLSKQDLIRIVKTPNANFELDDTGRKNGRGAYICKSTNCLEKLKKTKALNRAFKCEIDNKIYEQISEVIVARKD